MAEHLLEIKDLAVVFHTIAGQVQAVNGVNLHLDKGEVLAILGESGSGKSVTASAVLNLIDMPPGEITAGEIRFKGENLFDMPPARRRDINESARDKRKGSPARNAKVTRKSWYYRTD